MYNSKDLCLDEDLTFISYNQTINEEFTVDEIITSDLWFIEGNSGSDVIKAIPLFNCDEIISNNDSDKILDTNKGIILQNDENTIIQCISNDTGSIHYQGISLYAYTAYTKLDLIEELTVYCIVYDKHLNTLNNVEIDVYVDNEITEKTTTNNKGICKYIVNEPCTVKFTYKETDSNNINITGE